MINLLRRAGSTMIVAVLAITVPGASTARRTHPADDKAAIVVGQRSTSGPASRSGDAARPAATISSTARLLFDQPGWRVTAVYGFADENGTIAYAHGPERTAAPTSVFDPQPAPAPGERTLEMTWYPADQYDGYYRDRLEVSPPEAAKIDGWVGDLFRYSDKDFAVMLRPRGGVFVELRAQGDLNRRTFERLLTHIVRVDVRTWLSALPANIVTPDRVAAEAAKALAGVPLPANFDIATIDIGGANDPYQFGVAVVSRVGCAWIAEWLRAKMVGDEIALRRAAKALSSSRNWKILHRLDDEGDWPEGFWQIAENVAAGDPPVDYPQALDCR